MTIGTFWYAPAPVRRVADVSAAYPVVRPLFTGSPPAGSFDRNCRRDRGQRSNEGGSGTHPGAWARSASRSDGPRPVGATPRSRMPVQAPTRAHARGRVHPRALSGHCPQGADVSAAYPVGGPERDNRNVLVRPSPRASGRGGERRIPRRSTLVHCLATCGIVRPQLPARSGLKVERRRKRQPSARRGRGRRAQVIRRSPVAVRTASTGMSCRSRGSIGRVRSSPGCRMQITGVPGRRRGRDRS